MGIACSYESPHNAVLKLKVTFLCKKNHDRWVTNMWNTVDTPGVGMLPDILPYNCVGFTIVLTFLYEI
jgi:hypothetical protein